MYRGWSSGSGGSGGGGSLGGGSHHGRGRFPFPQAAGVGNNNRINTTSAPPKRYVAGLGRGASGFTTRSDIGNFESSSSSHHVVGSLEQDDENGTFLMLNGSGSRAAEQRAAKLAMLQQQQQAAAKATQDMTIISPWGQAPSGYIAGAGRGASRMGEDTSLEGRPAPRSVHGEIEDANISDTITSSSQQPNEQQKMVEGQYDDDDIQADMIWAAIDERMQQRSRKKRKGNTEDKNHQQQEEEEDVSAQTRRKIKSQFASVKQELSKLQEADWLAIPDSVGDHSLKFKKQQQRRNKDAYDQELDFYTPLSDSLLQSRITQNNQRLNQTVHDHHHHDDGGTTTSTLRNMAGLGAARETVLGMSLDRMSSGRQTETVDPMGYLTSMSSMTSYGGDGTTTMLAADTNVGDVHKARLLLKSVRDTNPHHPQGWIASARVEEAAGKLLKARKLIQEGCTQCPTSTDIWLEAARLHPPEVAKRILATAVRRIPHAIGLFLKAADLESHVDAKKAVMRKALEANPTSLSLWKAAIELEDSPENAKILLSVAVEKLPRHVELWLALARLETYHNAQKVLNQARKALPADPSIWIAASQLEESNNNENINDNNNNIVQARIGKLMDRAFASLAQHDAIISREQWLHNAEASELQAQAPLTAAAIVTRAVGLGVLPEDQQRTWSEDAKNALSKGAVATARAILAHALKSFPSKRSLWMQAVEMEKNHGTLESLDEVLSAASERLPHVELFWLLRAKEQWVQAGNVDKARDILTKAFAANPDSEQVWLAAAKLEWETGEYERARVLLQRARERAPTPRVYMKSALLEREQQHYPAALQWIEEGLERYPTFAKLYMMAGQIISQELPPPRKKTKSHLERARRIYQRGLEHCPNNVTLWILASRLEEAAPTFLLSLSNRVEVKNGKEGNRFDDNDKEKDQTTTAAPPPAEGAIEKTSSLAITTTITGSTTTPSSSSGVTKARSLLELARLKNPRNEDLWLEAIRLERRSQNPKLAEALMARALQDCPTSGKLLAEQILTAPRVEQKAKSADAIKRNPESPLVIAAVASLFAADRKVEKARKWLERAVLLDPDIGDNWARYYNLELESGQTNVDEQKQESSVQNSTAAVVKERCIKAEPKHGEIWQRVVKDMSNRHKSVAECLELVSAELRIKNTTNNNTTGTGK